ncbi:polyadenylate-specific 3'-exoribonuclease AS [Actinoplanes palleronii]|uniref:3'-5' exoribonuclease n=1 Tax=Actinoplanes palleronii TaxID=113570 RepID=A0ABQ4B2M1_9ACTN|nr:polyadenylate-specific 3'-exoribonuclease AS [Actinoplanes palleronii]GIE64914.1 3'-5' exoribonuclease [Actinoplanes palleronii]
MGVYRYFYDCEFIEDGRIVDLVSIGVVDEFGREFYAVSTEFDDSRAVPWVRRNVLDKLPSPADKSWRSRERIRTDLYEFLMEPLRGRSEQMELWAWYAAYDHVALAQLWGAMPALPREIPRFTKDLRQRWDDQGRPPLPEMSGRHDALVDARHNLARWNTMTSEKS